MNSTRVKICGLQSTGMLESIISLPIDYIGFVFAESKRKVSAAEAAEMMDVVHARGLEADGKRPLGVGVFVNPTENDLKNVFEAVKLDVFQLHGEESPDLCRYVRHTLGAKVFKAISVKDVSGSSGADAAIRKLAPYAGAIDGVLLDTYDPYTSGGTGRTFAWEAIRPYLEWARERQIPLFVAGGLSPDNVEQLLSEYHPDGVDVSSGVETDGIKDVHKIKSFVEKVKRHG